MVSPRIFLPRLVLAYALALATTAIAAALPPEPLTTAAAVLSLSGEQAGQRLKISVTGVVTAAEPDWSGQFFVQDETGGVFVENLLHPSPAPGDVVTVRGESHPGAFAPIISKPDVTIVGRAVLPAARAVPIERLESGVEDGQRIEIAGVVRRVRAENARLNLDLAVSGFRLQVRAPAGTSPPAALIGARVRVRGTTATHYNAALRQLTAVAVYVPRSEDFIVEQSEERDPFDQPVVPLNSVAQYRRSSGSGTRVHVRGTVTHQRFGQDVFLQDHSGGIRLESDQADTFAPGDIVEAAGFLEFDNFLPLLRDSTLIKVGHAAAVQPRPTQVAEVKNGYHHADLITLRGRILDRSTRPVQRDAVNFSGVVTTWLVQGDGLGFTIEHEDRAEDPALAAVPAGSVVDVDGVCLAEIDAGGKARSLKLLLPGAANLRVIERPSWFTARRLLAGVGLLSAILLVVSLWLLTASKRNAALNFVIRELERAQQELQIAHDTLEQKVVERSAQLQVAMTARKTAEVQFKAVLAERTRLARDLHDTLEQTLTGIALQLDTAARLFERSPPDSSHHLQLARNWLHQSQVELRRSIWDLRTRELEQFDLAEALRQSAQHLIEGSNLALEFAARGEKRPLPEIVEENVLRIGQEALTNVAKHAQASRVKIELEYNPHRLLLRIEDNGRGFSRPENSLAGSNHFGLLGMSERAKRLAGRVEIASVPGQGTVVEVEIPLDPGQPAEHPVSQADVAPVSTT